MLECHLHKVIWRLILQCTSHFFFFIVLKTRFQLCFALLSSFHLRAWCTRPVYKGGRKSLTSAAVPTRCSMRVFFFGGGVHHLMTYCLFVLFFFCWRSFFHSFSYCVLLFSFFFFHYVVFHRLCMFMCVCTCASAHLCAYYSFFFSKYYLTLTHSTPGRIRLCFLFFFLSVLNLSYNSIKRKKWTNKKKCGALRSVTVLSAAFGAYFSSRVNPMWRATSLSFKKKKCEVL